VSPKVDLDNAENIATAGIQSLGHPACSELLYQLSYPGPHFTKGPDN
jgi:hypothetical protein